jgi:signal transduction histidine kinase
MHDIVAHSLSVMVRLSDAAAAKLPVDPDRSFSAMVQVSVTGREALQDMRRLLGVLRTESEGTTLRPRLGSQISARCFSRSALPASMSSRK